MGAAKLRATQTKAATGPPALVTALGAGGAGAGGGGGGVGASSAELAASLGVSAPKAPSRSSERLHNVCGRGPEHRRSPAQG